MRTFLLVYLVVAVPLLSVIGAAMYWVDKRRAEKPDSGKSNRIPESTLLMIDLLGGWPGGWWGQQKLRHKTRKLSFRIRFYMAVAINIAVVGFMISRLFV